MRTNYINQLQREAFGLDSNPKELTPTEKILQGWIITKQEEEEFLKYEADYIRKKEREAARKAWDAALFRDYWENEENPNNEVPNREQFINENYPL
jgi:hypothetical protein